MFIVLCSLVAYVATMDLKDLTVPVLKAQLLARELDCVGNKATLIVRLSDALAREGVDIGTFVSQLLEGSVGGPRGADCATKVTLGHQFAAPADPVPPLPEDMRPRSKLPRDLLIADYGQGQVGSASVAAEVEGAQGPDVVGREDVCPNDSVSQVRAQGSVTSRLSRGSSNSIESQRAKESARRAGLQVRMKFLQEKQKLDRQEQEVRMKKEELQLEAEMKESEAREAALSSSRPVSEVTGAVGVAANNVSQQLQDSRHYSSGAFCSSGQRDQGVGKLDAQPRAAIGDQLMKKLLTSSLLPKPDIPVFSGDVTKYYQFIRAFDNRVGGLLEDDENRMYYLEQFTTGVPRDIVRGCLYLPSGGYQQARYLLQKRYGDPEKVADTFVDRILSWPVVKADDVAGMDRFALELRTCLNAVQGLLPESNELDHSKTLKRLLEKVPYHIQERWRRKVDSLKEIERRGAKFRDLVLFIEVEARIGSNASFGRQAFKREAPRAEKTKEPRTRCNYVASRNNGEQELVCIFCKGAHSLPECPLFAQKRLPEREDFIRHHALCFGCLKPGHRTRWCASRLTCSVCKKGHPSVLHRYSIPANRTEQPRDAPSPSRAAVNVVSAGSRDVVATKMPIVPVKLRHRDGPAVSTYAFLDSGSSSTFCSQELMDRLGVAVPPKTKLSVTTMAKQPLHIWTSAIEGLSVSDMDENNVVYLPTVFSLDRIPASREEVCRLADLSDWPYLQEVVPAEIDAEVGLLVGVNVPAALEPTDFISSRDGGPYAVKTKLGWVVNGPVRHHRWTQMRSTSNRIKIELGLPRLDSECLASEERGMSVEDRRWLQQVEKDCKRSDGHYELPLPVKTKRPLPDNSEVAMRRLQGLKKKMTDDEFAQKYVDFMDKMLQNGYAERVPDEDRGRCDGRVSYLPHHGVGGQKSGKLRVVFDCSSSFRGVALNDSLLQGPDLTTPLVDVLVRFRQDRIAFIGDVECMFYQVHVPREDRDLLRFLWWPGGDTTLAPEVYRMTVHPFGARSSPSVANYALRRTALNFGDGFLPVTKRTLSDHFYVDDCLKSVETVEEAVEVVGELRELCQKGGFRLTKFVSNSREVLESIPPEERGQKVRDLPSEGELPSEKALGVCWSVEDDALSFAVSSVPDKPLTRRGMLAVIGSLYDPLGMGAPFVLQGRQILQEMTRRNLHWDEPAPEDLADKWNDWLEGINLLSSVSIRRCLKPEGFGQVISTQLHHFSDASNKGYGVVSYLRFENEDGQVHCAFVFGKARVTPLKGMTIPRLELTAAVLAARVDAMLRRALQIPIDGSVFWTDSTTVIRYIRNEHTRFHTFVCNRVAVIRDASSPEQWRYVDTSQNPADDASRGQSGSAFVSNDRWIYGPGFLWKEASAWPSPPDGLDRDPVDRDPEVRRTVAAALAAPDHDPLDDLFQRYSSWHKLLRAVAWILRVRTKLKERAARTSSASDPVTSDGVSSVQRLTVTDLRDAEVAIVAQVQKMSFAKEYESLSASRVVSASSCLSRLDPFLDGGMIRVGGRLTNAPLSTDQKHPVILPKCHHVVDLIVQQVHEEAGHAGREHVLANLRVRFWVVKGNAAVRRVLSRCGSCRRRQGPFMSQKMADLPADRLTPDEPPFTSTGIDFFGPFFVKRGRAQEKRYGVIFSCLVSRAVHIEVADSLSTDSFLCALRRFVARRGQVKRIRTDRGTNFVGGERELASAVDQLMKDEAAVHDAMLRRNIEWTFNTPNASHHGGVWERMIRSIRKVLDGVLTQQTLTDETLRTLFCEVESVLNSRPLTVVSHDHKDPQPLGPNDILLLGGTAPIPAGVFGADDLYAKRRWRQVQYMADLFWSRWRREDVLLLQRRQKWLHPEKSLAVGNIVLVADDGLARCQWPLGRVIEAREGSDGLVRSVKLRTRGTQLVRPVTKLVLLCEE